MRRLLLVAAFVAVTIALIAVGAPSNWGALGFAIAAGVFGYAFLRRTPPRDTAPVAPAPEGIAPPITIADGDDISFYATVWDVVAEYEPWYPSWSAYRAFDAEGRRLDLYADPPIVRRRVIGPRWTDNAHKSGLSCARSRPSPPAPRS